MTSPASPPSAAEKPTVYRGVGALIGGVVVILFCLGGAIDLLVEEGGVDLPGAAVLFLVATLAFAYGVYPAALSAADRLVVRNPLRTVTLSWAAVTQMTAKLSFVVHTEQKRFTVWAVPVSLRERRRIERSRLKDLVRQERVQRRGRSADPSAFGLGSGPGKRGGGFDPIDRLSYADQAISEMNVRRQQWEERSKLGAGKRDAAEQGAAPAEPSIRWNIETLVPIAAAVVLLIVAGIAH